MQPQAIQYLQHQQINKQKWDQCIDGASNGLIYGYSYYLDAMASYWDALVLNDYEAVMPLPCRKKFGIDYIYQPAFTAQLGIFATNPGKDLVSQFLQYLPEKFRYWDFSLNHGNELPAEFPFYKRANYVLDLERDYNTLYSNYRQNIKRNIKKAIGYNCTIQPDINIDPIIELAKEQSGAVSKNSFDRFKQLFLQLKENRLAKTYGVYSHNRQLLASAAFVFSHNRAYYILVGNHPNGRTLGCSHALIDAFIKDHAGQSLLLDFEGSDIHNLAFFYSSFGAKEENYPAIRLNKMPWYLKWLKK